jgi:hypothetical protein
MLGLWVVVILLGILTVIDLRRAYFEFQQDKSVAKLIFHGVMLAGLSGLVINTVVVILGAESDLPYIQTHVLKTEPRYLKAHKPKKPHSLGKAHKERRTGQAEPEVD